MEYHQLCSNSVNVCLELKPFQRSLCRFVWNRFNVHFVVLFELKTVSPTLILVVLFETKPLQQLFTFVVLFGTQTVSTFTLVVLFGTQSFQRSLSCFVWKLKPFLVPLYRFVLNSNCFNVPPFGRFV
jgi:hypothetical protein